LKPFLKALFFGTCLILVVGIFPFLAWGLPYTSEILISFFLSLLNAIAGYILVLRNHGSEHNTFIINVYGGMLVRMAFVLGFSLYITMNGYLQTVPFFISLMIFYVIHQWTEISSWLKVLPSRKVQVS
tara:strand:+ start:430 stop:813 length:384 start_codon:yes stop_codon:yes gene_type:complete